MAFYRGMDGSVQWNSQAVSQVISWDASATLATLTTTVMGVLWETSTTGTGSWSANVTTRMDYGDTNGQKVMVDALLAATPSSTAVTVLLRESATKYLTGTAFVTGVTKGASLGVIIELRLALTGTGPLTVAWS